MLNEYRAVTSVDEVMSIIKRSQRGENTFIWLNTADERMRFAVGNFKLDKENFEFTCQVDNSALEHVRSSEFYYVKLDYDTSAFKVYVHSIDGNYLVCSLPDKILSVEKRSRRRKKVKVSKDFEVSLKLESEIMKDSFQEFNYLLMDYSKGGMGLLLLEEQMRVFSKQKGEVFLSKIGEHLLETSIFVDAVYFKKIDRVKNGITKTYYRIGFEFQEDLPPETLECFEKLTTS